MILLKFYNCPFNFQNIFIAILSCHIKCSSHRQISSSEIITLILPCKKQFVPSLLNNILEEWNIKTRGFYKKKTKLNDQNEPFYTSILLLLECLNVLRRCTMNCLTLNIEYAVFMINALLES